MKDESSESKPKRRKRRVAPPAPVDVGKRRGDVSWSAYFVGVALLLLGIASRSLEAPSLAMVLVRLGELSLGVAAVAYFAWLHRIVTVDRMTHGPLSGHVTSPIGAVAAHFVPLVQWWIPYTIVRDVARRAVGRTGKPPPITLWWLASWAPFPIWKGCFGRLADGIVFAMVAACFGVAAILLRQIVEVVARGQTTMLAVRPP